MGLFSSLFGKKEENKNVEGNKKMSKVLFVKANDRPAEQAVSSKMYETFVSTYKEGVPPAFR
ncbi:azoreductase, partial [Bacillus cereus]|nr:azoreductase [Bacillus cereus]